MLMPRTSQQYCCTYCLSIVFRPLLSAYHLFITVFLLTTAFLLASTLCFPTSTYAQSSTATLSGTVEDQKGAVVPGASIAVINADQGSQRLATTNSEGTFVFAQLRPGRYSVTATREGFGPVEIKDVVLNVNDQVAIRIHLNVGTVSQTVDIIDGVSLIDESPAVATVVDRQFVENIPLNGRSFQSLITLSPGVLLTKANLTEQGQFSVNGQRADTNYFTVDGVSATFGVSPSAALSQSAAGTLPGTAVTGGTNSLVSIDALQEFKIQTSTYAPEFGRTPGGQIQIVTRSGTNDYRGAAFEYFRNDALDANDFFANANRIPKAALRQNDFGFVLGGPLSLPRFGEGGPAFLNGRDRTFFFLSYEGLRLRLPQTKVTPVPSTAARLAAPAKLQPFLKAYPIPNGQTLANGFAQFVAGYSDPSSLDATSVRVDHALTKS